jgi:hypothetical protein
VTFSDRHGYTKARESLQLEAVDPPLRNRLWTLLKIFYWDGIEYYRDDFNDSGYFLDYPPNKDFRTFCQRTWHNYYKEPLDTLPNRWDEIRERFRDEFLSRKWYEVYNFLEWIAEQFPDKKQRSEKFVNACNKVLEEEKAGYRFIKGQITPITDANEMASIDKAASTSEGAVASHLDRSLELLSDRKNPDYRNSIKEAISAVEALAIKVAGQKSTLGQLLKTFDDHVPLHPALKGAFEKLYGYTSDEGGVRHALMEQEKLDFDDAKFMLVTCSAFINYVQSKLR